MIRFILMMKMKSERFINSMNCSIRISNKEVCKSKENQCNLINHLNINSDPVLILNLT